MKKITKKSPDALAQVMPVMSEEEQQRYIGGASDCYYGSNCTPESEFKVLLGSGLWTKGCVIYGDGEHIFTETIEDIIVRPHNPDVVHYYTLHEHLDGTSGTWIYNPSGSCDDGCGPDGYNNGTGESTGGGGGSAGGSGDGGGSTDGGGGSSGGGSSVLANVSIPFNLSKYKGYIGEPFDCMDVSKNIMNTILGTDEMRRWRLWHDSSGQRIIDNNHEVIVGEINRHLDAGRPIIADVSHTPGRSVNEDNTTDHWVVIMGRGYYSQKGQYYYEYVETSRSTGAVSKAFNYDKNRLYYDPATGSFIDPKSGKNNDKVYDLTQIRPNL